MFAESSHLRSRQRTSKPAKCIQFSYIPFALPRFNAPRFFERPPSFLTFHRCRRPSSPSKGCRRLSVSESSHSQRTSDSSHSASGIWLKSHWVQPMATAADRKGFVQTLRRGARSHEVPGWVNPQGSPARNSANSSPSKFKH